MPHKKHRLLDVSAFFFPIIFDVLPQVAGLASVMGVDAMKYKGDSQEVDDLCVDLQKLMR